MFHHDVKTTAAKKGVFLPARTRCLIFFASGDWETKAFSDVRVEATLLFVFFEDLGMCPVPERCSLYLRA